MNNNFQMTKCSRKLLKMVLGCEVEGTPRGYTKAGPQKYIDLDGNYVKK